ncbi:MAG: hypothetical protein Q7S37_02690 [bacterium]|nr:hypothetical protein [bacterium]
MKNLPQLNREQLNEWREEILGHRSKKFPESFLFDQLFDERSPLAKDKLLSKRIEILVKKYPKADTRKSLKEFVPTALEFLKENGFIDDETYSKESLNCQIFIENS